MRTEIYKLHNQIKHYEWGSLSLLPEFLGIENEKGIPYAEMWMGTHSSCPSQAQGAGSLTELAGELPFLFKLLAVQKPLSIQAHPNKTQAVEGFHREEKQGLSIKNPARNYKDSNHKPEIICAITPFTLMAGFREPSRISILLEEFISAAPQLKEIISPLLYALENGSLSDFFRILFGFQRLEREYIGAFLLEKEPPESDGSITKKQWSLMKSFAEQYPGDPAVISPLYINVLELQPGRAVFIPAGILHSYIDGFGVELMAASDNVLRCGLTPKYVDIAELIKILHFVPFMPQVITPHSSGQYFDYHTPCDDFSLAFLRGGEMVFPVEGPAICLVTEGELNTGGLTFKKGESFFIPKGADAPVFTGNYSLFAACSGANGYA